MNILASARARATDHLLIFNKKTYFNMDRGKLIISFYHHEFSFLSFPHYSHWQCGCVATIAIPGILEPLWTGTSKARASCHTLCVLDSECFPTFGVCFSISQTSKYSLMPIRELYPCNSILVWTASHKVHFKYLYIIADCISTTCLCFTICVVEYLQLG